MRDRLPGRGVEVTVRSKAWLDWYAKFHAERCAGVTCPVLPPPAPPLACATQARCVQHRCTDSCSAGSGAGK